MVDKDEPAEEEEEVSIEIERKTHKDLLREIIKTSKEAEKSIDSYIEKLNAGPDTSHGISFLDLKNGLLMEYNTNLTYLMLKKTKGESIEDDKAVERLCYLRTVMEKIRPIEQKLKYQIDKCVKIAETGHVSKDDPSRFKANPDSLASKLGEDVSDEGSDDEEDKEDEKEKSKQKYVAPRNVPKHYDGDKTKEDKETEMSNRKKKSALSHSMMRELQSQLWDTPEEISHQADTKKQKYIALEREKELYEEDMFMRLPVTKADRIARKNMFTVTNIADSITSFGNSSFGNDDGAGGKKRKSSHQGKGGKSKKKFKIKKKKF